MEYVFYKIIDIQFSNHGEVIHKVILSCHFFKIILKFVWVADFSGKTIISKSINYSGFEIIL